MPHKKEDGMVIGSPAFSDHESIPSKYTCQGENINPPLTVEHIPSGTKALAVIVEDPDAPSGTFDHWICWNMHPREMILENSMQGVDGQNSFGKTKYNGPCPPTGEHHYIFTVYALDSLLNLQQGAGKGDLQKAMEGHIKAEGKLVGLYRKG